jgi:hypothetical protein
VPESWQSYLHPNLDVYYFNLGMRLLSTDDIRKPEIRALLLEIRNDCFEELADDRVFQRLPIDWVMTITDCVIADKTAVVRVHSRSLGKSYKWGERGTWTSFVWRFSPLSNLLCGDDFEAKLTLSSSVCRSRLDGGPERRVLDSYR